MSKSNLLTNFGLSSEEVLDTPLPYFFHHSPFLTPIAPSKSLLLLSIRSCRNTGDLVGSLGHLVGSIRTSYTTTYSGLFWGRFVEKASRKIGEEPYLPPKPSDLSSPSLTHLPHHQEYSIHIFTKKDKKEKRLLCSFICSSKVLIISYYMPRIVRITHMLA